MTDGQQRLIITLCNEREVPSAHASLMAKITTDQQALNVQRASDCIRWLLTLPRAIDASTARDDMRTAHYANQPARRQSNGGQIDPALVPGVYEVNGDVFVVRKNRHNDRLHARRLVVLENVKRLTEAGEKQAIDFIYAPGAIFQIKVTDRMSLERAKELTVLYGCCVACGAHLKATKSVAQGIGPWCIKKFGPVLDPNAITVDGRTVKVRAA